MQTPSGSGRPDGPVDLHLHSTCSDGLLPVAVVAAEAAAAGLAVAALTDHDSTDGWAEFSEECRARGVEPMTGVEISTRHPSAGERHLLGYGFDPSEPRLAAALARNRAARRVRAAEIVEVLRGLGLALELDEVLAEAGGDSVGRPHVADVLVRSGQAFDRREAFDRWLGDGRPAAVPKRNLGSAEAIALLHGAGGVAVLAHPGRGGDPAALPALLDAGLDGLEVWHPSHSEADRATLAALARRHGLLQTGGSDNHGDAKGMEVMRSCRVPGRVARDLAVRLRRRPGHQSTGSCP